MSRRDIAADAQKRETLVESIFARLHPVMAWLAGLFILVIVGENVVRNESPFATIFLVAAALATTTGEPTRGSNAVSMGVDVVLSLYSVVVFAAVAGSLGAFFLEHTEEEEKPDVV